MANPFQFLQEVRQEATKVTWPQRAARLTITTVLVMIMCVMASLFLFAVDQAIHLGDQFHPRLRPLSRTAML